MLNRIALATAALAATALLGACDNDDTPDKAADRGTPTASSTPDPTATDSTGASSDPTGSPSTPGSGGTSFPLETDNLLTDADTVYSDGADWFRTGAAEGDGQSVFHPCAQKSLAGTGATKVVRADFELRNTQGPKTPVKGDSLIEVVGEYDDAAAAQKAYDLVSDWATTCTPAPPSVAKYRSSNSYDVPAAGDTGKIIDSTFEPGGTEPDPADPDSAYIAETGLAVVGNRLVVLTSVIWGQDYNFLDEDGGTPVNRMLPKAVHLLR